MRWTGCHGSKAKERAWQLRPIESRWTLTGSGSAVLRHLLAVDKKSISIFVGRINPPKE